MKLLLRLKGGPGSGHRGHSGRPGKRGGSSPGAGGVGGEKGKFGSATGKRGGRTFRWGKTPGEDTYSLSNSRLSVFVSGFGDDDWVAEVKPRGGLGANLWQGEFSSGKQARVGVENWLLENQPTAILD